MTAPRTARPAAPLVEGPAAVAGDGLGTPAAPPPTGTGRLVRSSAAVGIGTMLSRATGLLRVVVLLRVLGGRGALPDAYNLANTTPNMIYDLLLGGVLAATLVPIFVDLVDQDDDEGVSAVVTIAVSLLTALTVASVLAAPWIFRLYTAGKDAGAADRLASVGVPLLRFFLPQVLFYGITAIGTALLNARRSFLVPAFAPVVNNLVVIAVLLALPSIAGEQLSLDVVRDNTVVLVALGLGTTAGIVTMAAALWPEWRRRGTRLRVNFDWHHPAIRRVLSLSGWTLGYVAVNQVAFVAITNLATRVDGVAPYTNAFVFFQLPAGLFAISIMTAFAPDLAALASARDGPGFRKRFLLGFRLLWLVIVPAAVGTYVLAGPALGAFTVVGGLFGAEDAKITGDVLAMFALGLVGFSVYLYGLRAFYAMKNTRFPFFAAILQNGLNVVFAVALYGRFRVQGLAFAYSLSYTLAAVAVLLALRYRLGRLGARTSIPMLVKVAAATAVMGVWVAAVAARVGGPLGGQAVVRVVAGVAVGVVFLGAGLLLLRVREVSELTSRLRARLPGTR